MITMAVRGEDVSQANAQFIHPVDDQLRFESDVNSRDFADSIIAHEIREVLPTVHGDLFEDHRCPVHYTSRASDESLPPSIPARVPRSSPALPADQVAHRESHSRPGDII